MLDDPRTKPLQEWNRLARANTETAMVSSMLAAIPNASGPIDSYSTWLLAAAAAIGSFLISNVEKMLPLVQHKGFLYCGLFLCCSCACGLLAKMAAIRCKVGLDVGNATRASFQEHFDQYKSDEKKIKEGAEFWGITLETGIRQEKIMSEFLTSIPAIPRWKANRELSKLAGNPHAGYIIQAKNYFRQGMWTSFQSFAFLGFLVSGFYFSAVS